MNVALINRKTHKQYWMSTYGTTTNQYRFALFTTDVVKISKIVKKFIKEYKIIIVNATTGEVIKKYE